MTIYFIQAVQGGPIKIGHTADRIRTRLTDIQRMCPIPLQIIGVIDGDEELESTLHFHFREYRLHGEWFEPVNSLLNLIQQEGQGYPDLLLPLHSSNKRTCQGIRFNGEPCGGPAVVGTSYCQHHSATVTNGHSEA